MVLAGREVDAACIANVFAAQHTGGIAGLGLQALQGNGLGVLLRLCHVDGDLQIAVFGGGVPLNVLGDLRSANVVCVDAKLIEPIGGCLGALLGAQLFKNAAAFAFAGHQKAHDACLKVYAELVHLAVKQALFGTGIQQSIQNFRGISQAFLGALSRKGSLQTKQIQQSVAGVDGIQLVHKAVLLRKLQKAFDLISNLHVHFPPKIKPSGSAAGQRPGSAAGFILSEPISSDSSSFAEHRPSAWSGQRGQGSSHTDTPQGTSAQIPQDTQT